MKGQGLCGVCQAAAQQACGSCGEIFYCSKEHQRKHWATHRQYCQPYRIASSPEAGQYLVAGRHLRAGQRILRDTPLVVGPLSTSSLVCLGCNEDVDSDNFATCTKCEWPLCSAECAYSISHKDECSLLARDTKRVGTPKNLDDTPRYDIIMVLRCLLLQANNPAAWKVILSMDSHVEQRMVDKDCHHMATVSYITQVLKVDFDTNTVHLVRSAIATNSVEIRSEQGARLRALYPRIRLLNHSCIPNTHLTCGSHGVMEVRTAVPVESGDPLHICYTGTTIPYWERQSSLQSSYYFTCACKRCEDPTEAGTHFSSPRCSQCTGFYLQPSKILGEIVWVCQSCQMEQSNSAVEEHVNEWIEKLETNTLFEGTSTEQVAAALSQAEAAFHPSHYVWMRVAQKALWQMRNNSLTRELLQLRQNIWISLLALCELFEPGLTRRRGMSLLETGKAIIDAALHEYEENESFLPQRLSQAELAAKYYQEASHILGLDPPGSMEASLAKRAEEKKMQIEEFLAQKNPGRLRAEEKIMDKSDACEVCGANEASVTCDECDEVHYCCSSHQQAHWEQHKETCRPSVIEKKSPLLGRYLVAAYDVKAGDLLFKEKPIALGPRANSRPVCLGCHKAIEAYDFPRCPKCLWPLCSPACASAKLHEAECPLLAEDKGKIGQPADLTITPRYDIILVLRCLLLRHTNQKAWTRFLTMASHAVHLVESQEPHHMATTKYIKDVLKAKYDPKLIHHARGAIMTNCFEWNSPLEVSLRGVYPKMGRINHSCYPNVTVSSDCDGVMYVRAAVDLKAQSQFYITYTGSLIPIWERQAYLNEIHYFNCDCNRCNDPTELGLHYSSPKCENCQSQYLESHTWLGETAWECPLCHSITNDFVVKTEYFQWLSRFDCNDTFIKTNPKGVCNILDKVESTFHPKHHVWVMAAQVAIRTLKNDESRESLTLRCNLWRRLMQIYSVLEPGLTLRRGITLYELGICEATLTRVEMKEGRLTDHFFNLNMKEALEHLEEAIEILSLEPPRSHERRWYDKAVQLAENVSLEIKPELEKNVISPMIIFDSAEPFEKILLKIRDK